MKNAEQRLAWALEICQRMRLRMTPVRRAVLAFLADRRMPASLEMIEQAEGVRGRCDATTVYRTLMLFKEAELLRLIGTPHKVSHFLLNVPDEGNHFLICRHCGGITELPLPQALSEAIEKIAAAHGFTPAPQDCEVYGVCNKCQTERQTKVAPSKLAVSMHPSASKSRLPVRLTNA